LLIDGLFEATYNSNISETGMTNYCIGLSATIGRLMLLAVQNMH